MRKTLAGNDKLAEAVGRVRLLALDVDGVLTDGGLYYTDAGDELRKFDVKDGMGIKRVLAAGIEVALLTASTSRAIAHRGRRLGIRHVFTGVEDKLEVLRELCAQLGIGLEQVAYIADDVNDLPVLRAVGVALAVADAMPEVREAVDRVGARGGGAGAVREVCDMLMRMRA